MLIDVHNMDTGEVLWFSCKTPYMAMKALLYTLGLKKLDKSAVINKTESGLHLYTIYNGEYWAVRNQ